MIRLLACVIMLFAAAGCQVTPDNEIELHLKDGRVVKGEVISNDGKNIKLKGKNGTESIHISEIRFNEGRVVIEGVVAVKTGDKWGFVDTSGNIVVVPKYDDALPLMNGRAPVKLNNKWGYINRLGKVVIPFEFGDAKMFVEEYTPVKKGFNYGYIDTTGKMIFDNIYIVAGVFSESLAFVNHMGDTGYINKEGKLEISNLDADFGFPFKEGHAVVLKDGKKGYINRKGELITGYDFIEARVFKDGMAAAYVKDSDGCSKCGFIDTLGNWIVKPVYEDFVGYFDGYSRVTINHRGYLVDRKGKIALEHLNNTVGIVSEGLVAFKDKGKYGFVDTLGNIVIKPRYEKVVFFYKGYSMVAKDGSINYIDKNDRKIIEAK